MIQLFSILGSFGTLAGLVITNLPSSLSRLQTILLTVTVILMGIAIIEHLRTRPKRFKNSKQIRDYMYNWISKGARVAIFSRDLSWVEDDEMKKMLQAKGKDLEICVPSNSEKTKELKKAGVKVYSYSKLEYFPLARFTIINRGREDAQVAIGKTGKGGVHCVTEYGLGEHQCFALANDLIEVISRIQ